MSKWPSRLIPPVCRLAVLLLWSASAAPAALAQPPAAPIEVSGATYVEYDERAGVLRAEGRPVVITRGRTVLRAPRVEYTERTRTLAASGGAQLEEPGLTVRADALDVRLTDDRVRASGAVSVHSTREDPPTTLTAAEIDGSLQTRRFAAAGAVSVVRGELRVSGQRLDYDDQRGLATVTGDPRVSLRDATMTAETVRFDVRGDAAYADGGVRVHSGDLVGTAPRAEIRGRDRRAVLLGGARVDRGADRVTAESIEVDLEGSIVTARGGSRLVITPP